MQNLKKILLLLVFGMMLFPWKLICIAHPFGHNHQHHKAGKLSPCELRKQYNGNGPAIFPPMHCKHLSPDTDDYQVTEKFQIKPAYQTLVFAFVLFEKIKITYPEQLYIFPPDPKSRSAPFISTHLLRAPPFC